MRFLCIDFGLRHLGLAMADGPLAEPFDEKSYQQEIQALQFIVQLCQEHKIEALVLGLPEGRLAETVRNFSDQLKQLTNLPIFFQDEALSTKEAKAKLMSAHAPQKKRRFNHRAAAALILQNYLDRIN